MAVKSRGIIVLALVVIAIVLSAATGILDWFGKTSVFIFSGLAIFLAAFWLADWFLFSWLDQKSGRFQKLADEPLPLAIVTAALLLALSFLWIGMPK